MHSPPEPLKKSANLYQRVDWLVNAVLFLVFEALNTRHETEHIVADVTGLTQALDDFKAEVATHATKIDTQLAQLIAAQNSGDQAAIDTAAASIREQTAALQSLDVALDADDAPGV